MFIFILDPVAGNNNVSGREEKAKDPDRLLNLLFANTSQATCNIDNNPADSSPETLSMKASLIREMTRAAGRLLTRDMAISQEVLTSYLEKLTGIESTKERQKAFGDFFNALRNEKPDVKSNPEIYLEALITTWNKGIFECLPKPPITRPREDDHDLQYDIRELKKKGIEVLDGGVDPIAGARIKLRINGVEYEGMYGGLGGVNADSLRSATGSPPSADVIKLVKENNELITRVGMSLGYHNSTN